MTDVRRGTRLSCLSGREEAGRDLNTRPAYFVGCGLESSLGNFPERVVLPLFSCRWTSPLCRIRQPGRAGGLGKKV